MEQSKIHIFQTVEK